MDTTFSTASFIDNKPDTKIKNKPWKALRELNLASSYKTIIGSLEFEINSFPLSKNDYRYWDTNLGLYSKNLKNIWKALPIQELHFYTSYSPFYGGNYDVFRTFKAGFKTTVNKYITFDLFLEDESL